MKLAKRQATPSQPRPRQGPRRTTVRDPLAGLRNIGPAMRADLALLGIDTLEQLAASEADGLYAALQAKTGQRHDPCVWDTFAAAIHQARTGEARDWWAFTPVRKQRQAAGQFPPKAVRAVRSSPAKPKTSRPRAR